MPLKNNKIQMPSQLWAYKFFIFYLKKQLSEIIAHQTNLSTLWSKIQGTYRLKTLYPLSFSGLPDIYSNKHIVKPLKQLVLIL